MLHSLHSRFAKIRSLNYLRHRETGRLSKSKIMLAASGLLAFLLIFRQAAVLVVLNILAFVATPFLPSLDSRAALTASQSTIIYDRDGGELYTVHGDENRFAIPAEKIPDELKLATIAAEDDQFFKHPGFDIDAILKAVLSEAGIGPRRGGSTITQQFVKNAYLSSERSYTRKIRELLLATKLENKFSKDEILTMYLNRIPYGNNAYGVQAAAETFFGKNAEQLTLAESVVLAGIPQAPTRFNPYGSTSDLLLGSCDSGKEVANNQQLPIVTVAVPVKQWLQISVDGRVKFSDMLTPEKPQDFAVGKSLDVLAGRTDYTLTLGRTQLAVTGKHTRLDGAELASIAAATPAPKDFVCESPTDKRYTKGRVDYVLERMQTLKYITPEESLAAWRAAHHLTFVPYHEDMRAPHFVVYVKKWLEQQFGKDLVERGGLRVYTSLDPALQAKAEELIAATFPHETDALGHPKNWKPNYADASNAALLSVNNATGEILAMVGSRDYWEKRAEDGSGNDGATNLAADERLRQPGSSFKPIVYGAGFEKGYAPATVLWDVDTTFGYGAGAYNPKNFDGTFWGPTTVRRALQGSRNVPAVKMAILVGEQQVVNFAKKLGFTNLSAKEENGPAIGLGTDEITMQEMVGAYSTYARGGVYRTPTAVLKVTDSAGNLLDEYTPVAAPAAIDPAVAYLVTDVLSDAAARPAGWSKYLTLTGRPAAAKTGTANRRFGKAKNAVLPGDIWTVGYTPQITTAVWAGNNDATPMNLRGEGLTICGPIWQKFMNFAHQNLPVASFSQPAGIVTRSVSKLSGKLASSATPSDQIVTDKFASWAVPLQYDTAFVTKVVDKITGKLATEYTPVEAREERTYAALHSEQPNNPLWERPVQAWLARASSGDNPLFSLAAPPTEYDDLHTATSGGSQPTVSIISPVSGGTIRTGSVEIAVQAAALNGVQKVEYSVDGVVATTATAAPFTGRVVIPKNLPNGSRVTISAKAYDRLGYTDTSNVEVVVGADTQPPVVEIAPLAAVTRGGQLQLAATAYDSGGELTGVVFAIDGATVQTFRHGPFTAVWQAGASTRVGSHTFTVTATDTAGHTTTAEATFEITAAGSTLAPPPALP